MQLFFYNFFRMITIVDYLLLPEIDPKPLQRPYIGPEYVGVRSSGA